MSLFSQLLNAPLPRFILDGYAPGHPQSQTIYQTQGPPGVVQTQQPSQSNPAQSLSNQQNQARLTPMTQPTAPPTPPNQQQQQQAPQQTPQYAVQMQQSLQSSAGGTGNPRNQPQQYRQPPGPRRQQPLNQQFMYQPMGYQIVLPTGSHVRSPYANYIQYAQPHVPYPSYQPAVPTYSPMPPQSNNQQRQSTPQATGAAMTATQPGEYPAYTSMEMYPQVMPTQPVAQPAPSQPPQKTVKKSKAIQIINPLTGKNIFEEDSTTPAGGSIATVDKAITASHNELNKDEVMEKESPLPAEPSTPVVSAMSDGPSVDITPKHQVNKIKKIKPAEPVILAPPQVDLTQPPPQSAPKPVERTEIVAPVVQQDNENNNINIVTPVPTVVSTPVQVEVEEVKLVKPVAPVAVVDVNDTNNNNYQKASSSDEKEVAVVKEPVAAKVKEAEAVPQDTNNNSTDDKSVMTSPSIRHTTPAPEVAPVTQTVPAAAIEEKAVPERKISVVDGPIDYDDGQWSPANLEGKKYYTRDQLLKLKDQPIAQVKLPDAVSNQLLKNNKDFLYSTLTQSMPPQNMGQGSMQRGGPMTYDALNSLAPKFMANQLGNRNPYQKRPSQQGNKQGQMQNNGRSSQSGMINLTLSLNNDVKLNEADNAWKPSHLVKKADMTEDEYVTHDLLSRFRSMLNKLTAENFDLLVEQVKLYKIDTSERLDGVISLLFEKAISEPKFAPTYARLCQQVAMITTAPQNDTEKGKKTTLKTKLITQCQKEFERHREESIVFNDIEDKLREIENHTGPEKRDEEKARLEEEHYKVRQRANGTVKFIGELFKIDMLTWKIMLACIDMLLQEATEERVERVCKLLTTIGGKMEKGKQEGGHILDKYFQQLHEMLHPNHKTIRSSRIKFEIQNLQDLRMSGWKSRRQDLMPKTLDQIQADVEQEQQMINYQTRQNAKDDRNRGNQGNYNRRQQDSDGWSVQQNSKNSRAAPLQIQKISLPSYTTDLPKLGNPTDFQKFGHNSNKFAALPVDSDTDIMPRYGGGSKNSSMERGDRGSSRYYGNGSGGNSGNDGRYSGRSSGSNQGSRNSSQIRSRDNSDQRGGPSRSLQGPPPRHQQQMPGSNMSFSGALKAPQKPPSAPAPPAGPMSREDVVKNYEEMMSIVDEYRKDKVTIEKAVDKLRALSINKDVLVEVFNQYLDRKPVDRENLVALVVELLKCKKLSSEDNRLALVDTMSFAPDMVADIPYTYEYIAHFFGKSKTQFQSMMY